MHIKPLFPIPCLIVSGDLHIKQSLPPRETIGPRIVTITWPGGVRQRVGLLYEDVITGEAYIQYWVRVNNRAEAIEHNVPNAWLQR